jgi:hypothetical protein
MMPPMRLARATVFAVVCVSLTLLAHATASRAPVSMWAVGVAAVAVIAVAAVLAGRERSLSAILGALLGGQFCLHALFGAVQPDAMVHAGHAHAAMGAVPAAQIVMSQSSPGMLLAHLAAAAMTAWWLRRGERAAWALARHIAALAVFPLRRMLTLFGVRPVDGLVRIRPHDRYVPRRVCAVLRYTVVLRGPPCLSAALQGS